MRVVSNTKEFAQIDEKLGERYNLDTQIPFIQKQIYAFYEQPDGRDICFFGIQTQEYGSDAPGAHKNIAYLAYIDSCQLFHVPECNAHNDKVGIDTWLDPDSKKHDPCSCHTECNKMRKFLIQTLMHGYMEYLRQRCAYPTPPHVFVAMSIP